MHKAYARAGGRIVTIQLLRKLNLTLARVSGIVCIEGRGKTSLGTPARDLLAPPLKKEKGE